MDAERERPRQATAIDAPWRRWGPYLRQRVFSDDPHWRDLISFHEHFHGDNGAGIGTGHQTGWTAMVAVFLVLYGKLTAADFLADGPAGEASTS